MPAVGKCLVQVIFHTDTEVDVERRKEAGQFVVGIFGIVAEKLRLESGIECIEPLIEGFITDVTVEPQHIVTDLVIAQRVFWSRIDIRFPFQFVCELHFVLIIIVHEILAVGQVQSAHASLMPVRGNIILCKLDSAFEV